MVVTKIIPGFRQTPKILRKNQKGGKRKWDHAILLVEPILE